MELNPYLFFNGNCAEAFRFYERVLGRVWGESIGAPSALDASIVGLAVATLTLTGLAAAVVPALGAARVEPNLALRSD